MPRLPEFAEFVGIAGRELLDLLAHPRIEKRIFVADFDECDRRFVDVSVAGVWVRVREQLLRVHFLQFDEALVKQRHILAERGDCRADAVVEARLAVDKEIDVDIDAFVFE